MQELPSVEMWDGVGSNSFGIADIVVTRVAFSIVAARANSSDGVSY